MRKLFLTIATTAAIAAGFAVSSGSSQAALVIQYSLDGGATFHGVLQSADPTGPIGEIDFDLGGQVHLGLLSAASNSPGTPSIAELMATSMDIRNTSDARLNFIIAVSATGFMQPDAPPPVSLISDVSGSFALRSDEGNLLSLTSCVLANVNANSCSGSTLVRLPPRPR